MNEQQVVDAQVAEVDKIDQELLVCQRAVLDAIQDYGKVSMGPGYLKQLNIRLNLVNQRLEST